MAEVRAVSEIELTLLGEAVYQRFGYDFRHYAHASLSRRVELHMGRYHIKSISQLQDRVLHDDGWITRFVEDVSVHVTEMFRDPSYYRAFRTVVIPFLRSFPLFHLWHAGCSTGEEVYSTAILLHEEGLLARARIYATDISSRALDVAREGIYSMEQIQAATTNYHEAGYASDFSHYYTASYGKVMLSPQLKKHITFHNHNLATDASFQQFEVILCRNVMIYFDQALKARALDLFHDSLVPLGKMIVGLKEPIHHSGFDPLDLQHRIYQRSQ